MSRKSYKLIRKAGTGKLMTGILLGGAFGAALGWLTAPTAGAELRHRLRGDVMSARDRQKNAAGKVGSRVRDLAEEVSD